MTYYLFIIGVLIVVFGYFVLLVDYLKYKKKLNYNIEGFGIAQEIVGDDHYVVLDEHSMMSYYDLKRGVIKLSRHVYFGKDVFSFAIVSYLSCLSCRQSSLRRIGKIIPRFFCVSFSSIIMCFLSYLFYTKTDAKIGIVIGFGILFYQYFYMNSVLDSYSIACDRLRYCKKDILSVIFHLYRIHQLFFISSFIFILRYIILLF